MKQCAAPGVAVPLEKAGMVLYLESETVHLRAKQGMHLSRKLSQGNAGAVKRGRGRGEKCVLVPLRVPWQNDGAAGRAGCPPANFTVSLPSPHTSKTISATVKKPG